MSASFFKSQAMLKYKKYSKEINKRLQTTRNS